MAFPTSLHAEIDQAVQDSISEFVEKRNSGLPRAAVLATTSKEEIVVNSVGGFVRVEDDVASSPEITDESFFPLWSSTKLVTAIAAMQLYEQGKIDLKGDASRYVPELKDLKVLKGLGDDGEPQYEENTHVCTVENLITHTAGFKYQYDPAYAKIQEELGLTQIYEQNSTRESLTKSPFLLPPGTAFSYGTANDWLALVISNVSGLPFGEYLQKNIFEPLGINDFTFKNPSSRVNVATAPETGDGPFTFDEGRQFTQNIAWGGAGLTGSPKSYLKILRMLLNAGKSSATGQQVLKPETVDLMFEPHLEGDLLKTFIPYVEQGNDPWSHKAKKQFEGANHGYGGVVCGKGIPSGRSQGALTWSGYANSFWVVDRKKDVAFIVWSCLLPHSHPSIMALWEKVEPKIYEGIAQA
ncbi:serine hydrolase domain-containing protein [Sporobolomyces salmoneus]|uniref:serine hydrolase domain-containing protein n=1 Tax=Sporobolomyces salmoneus TaxID=183962 RepID=UPI00317774B5